MADHTFKFPTVASATSTLTFTRAWRLGEESYYRFNGENAETYGGTFRSVSRGTNPQVQPLTVQVPRTSESATDWADVVAFVNSTVNFGVSQFVWTDCDSVSHDVRLENTDLNPKAAYPNYIEYTFLLRLLT